MAQEAMDYGNAADQERAAGQAATDVTQQFQSQRRRIDPGLVIGRGQFLQRPDQRFGDETAAVAAEMPAGIGKSMEIGDRRSGHGITVEQDRPAP